VAVKVPLPVPPDQEPTVLRMPLTAKVWLVQPVPGFVTWTVPPLKLPVTSVGMLWRVVASWKLPPVIVAVVEQPMQRAVC
jgi:hypothetical protein